MATDVYGALREKLDYASFVPTPVRDYERADLRKRDGTPYTVLKNPHGDGGAGSYLQLEPADVELLELMDGQRKIKDILVEHLQRKKGFALDRLARLTAALAANGFFGEPRPHIYRTLRRRKARKDPVVRASLGLRRLIVWNIASWSNAERLVNFVYRAGGRLAFTRIGALAIVAFALAGLLTWVREFASPRHDLLTLNGSYVAALVLLLVMQVLSISVHEAGHALAIRHFGRRVRKLGVAMYYLFPCMYVDSTDMVLASRRQRIVVSLAGPIGGLTIGAACAFVAAAAPNTLAGAVAFKGATLFVFQFVLNLLPILDLDGYHILVDSLDAPLLRQRALGFVRGVAVRKLRRRERWTRSEIGLATFGVLAIVISLLTLLFSLWIWQTRIGPIAGELWESGVFGAVIIVLIALVFIGPLIVALVGRVLGAARTAMRIAANQRRKSREAVIGERVAALSKVSFFSGLTRAALTAVATHLREERFEPDQIVITAGEPGDRFYLVQSGRLEALSPDGALLNTIGPGDGFGELALLDRTTRTATVRAVEPVVLWSLDRGHFHRWVKDRYEVAARIRSSADERAGFAQLPFFKGLGKEELDRFAARMRTRRVAAGEVVFRAGEPGDRYYIVREGTAEVSVPGGATRTLGPGDGFGELALLFDRPRSATVTAVTDLVLNSLTKADFAALVRASGETVGEFRERTGHYVGAGLGGAVAGGS